MCIQGVFFSFVLNGIIGQYLAIFHLFSLQLFILIFVLLLLVLHREAVDILRCCAAIPSFLKNIFYGGEYLLLVMWSIFVIGVIINLLWTMVPSALIDVWVHHIPIAKSIVNNGGFVYPSIDGRLGYFFGNMPSFVELLYAEGFVFTTNVNVANVIHFVIFVSFLITIASMLRGRNAMVPALLTGMLFLPQFNMYCLTPMTDTARATFETAALIFLVVYFRNGMKYYLLFAALVAGAGVASKYFGMVTLFICGILFLMEGGLSKKLLKDIMIFSAGVVLVAGFWYVKNAILYDGNPVYPFYFAHPGISDSEIANLNYHHKNTFYPIELSQYSRGIISIDGWVNLVYVIVRYVLPPMYVLPALLIIVCIGAIREKAKKDNWYWLLFLSGVVYLAVWYFMIFITARYAISALMMIIVASVFYIDSISDDLLRRRVGFPCERLLSRICWKKFMVVPVAVFLVVSMVKASRFDLNLFKAYAGSGDLSRILERRFIYYNTYLYISKNKLKRVYKPLVGHSKFFFEALDISVQKDTFVPDIKITSDLDDPVRTLKASGIQYFIVNHNFTPPLFGISPYQERKIIIHKFLKKLARSSEVVFKDRGVSLYKAGY